MNILVITPHGMYFDYTLSFVHNQARAFVAAGHRVRVVVPLAFAKRSNEGNRFGPVVEHFTQDGVEVCYLRHLSLSTRGSYRLNPLSALLMMRLFSKQILQGFQPDVVYGHTIIFAGRINPFFQKKYQIPSVLTTHGGDTDVSIQPEHQADAKALCDRADAVVAVSGKLSEMVRSLNSETPISCIWNGFAVQNCRPTEKEPYSILQAGSLQLLKHVDVTIHAYAHLKAEQSAWSLTVAGSGPEREPLEALSRQLAVPVLFLGQLSNQKLLEVMGKSRFFVMPSYPEGFGIVYLEAMASGCITIGTEGEGIADVITSGENGFLVPKNDPDAIADVIRWCIAHPAEADAIAQRGQDTAMELTWERNAAQYVELFETLRKGTR